MPFLSRATCSLACTRSICSQRRDASSDARSPCLKATRIMVASRCPYRLLAAAFIRRSTSRSVRYSRTR
jgi:hypothetical protein